MTRLLLAAFGAASLLAGCASSPHPVDTGSMAQPAPVSGTGSTVVGGSTTRGVDTGSMSVVRPGTGMMATPRTSVDTGSMSVPAAK